MPIRRRVARRRGTSAALVVRKPSTARSRRGGFLLDEDLERRSRAFDEGVGLGEMFLMFRQALLQQYVPGRPPLFAARRFPSIFIDLIDIAIHRFPHHYRDLLTTELIAGLMCELLEEVEWRHFGV
jgi:hypothetical protein